MLHILLMWWVGTVTTSLGDFLFIILSPLQGVYINHSSPDTKSLIPWLHNARLDTSEQRRQLDLLNDLNREHLAMRGGADQALNGRVEAMETAFRMQFAATDAFDLSRETASTRKAYGKSAGLGAVVVMAGIYVAVFPMFLSATGNEGARRSWAFTYFFVGVLIACWMAQRNQSGKWPRRVWGTLLGPAAIVLLIGNIASDLPADYRFPGGYVHGADTRAVTPEAADLARWFRDTLGANRRVIADRSGSMVLDAFARALSSAPSEALPVWDVLLKAELPSADTMAPFEAE